MHERLYQRQKVSVKKDSLQNTAMSYISLIRVGFACAVNMIPIKNCSG